jgi:CHAT domain-containing protein
VSSFARAWASPGVIPPGDVVTGSEFRIELSNEQTGFGVDGQRARQGEDAVGLVAGPGARPGLAAPPPAPLASGDLQALERDLPAGTAVLEYAVLRDRTVFWFLRRGRPLQCGTLPVGGAALDALVGQFRKSILARPTGDGDRAFRAQAEQLYEDLIRPVAKLLGPGERLTVVLDGALQVLPFSLLRDRLTDHFLSQDHALAVAPSLRALSASYRRDVLLVRQATRRMFVVSAPDFDRALEPALAPLSGLDARFASIFPGSRVLGGGAAAVDAFLRLGGSFEIVHFGGHALVSADSPLASRLLFARNPSAPGAGALYSGDVLRTRFARTRIVVLASCGTALGRISGSEGVESLARPFLAAGVPVVVAALWDTDDRVANDLFARFYGALRRRGDAANALRSAVVEMIEHGSPAARFPVSWGGFESDAIPATAARLLSRVNSWIAPGGERFSVDDISEETFLFCFGLDCAEPNALTAVQCRDAGQPTRKKCGLDRQRFAAARSADTYPLRARRGERSPRLWPLSLCDDASLVW